MAKVSAAAARAAGVLERIAADGRRGRYCQLVLKKVVNNGCDVLMMNGCNRLLATVVLISGDLVVKMMAGIDGCNDGCWFVSEVMMTRTDGYGGRATRLMPLASSIISMFGFYPGYSIKKMIIQWYLHYGHSRKHIVERVWKKLAFSNSNMSARCIPSDN